MASTQRPEQRPAHGMQHTSHGIPHAAHAAHLCLGTHGTSLLWHTQLICAQAHLRAGSSRSPRTLCGFVVLYLVLVQRALRAGSTPTAAAEVSTAAAAAAARRSGPPQWPLEGRAEDGKKQGAPEGMQQSGRVNVQSEAAAGVGYERSEAEAGSTQADMGSTSALAEMLGPHEPLAAWMAWQVLQVEAGAA